MEEKASSSNHIKQCVIALLWIGALVLAVLWPWRTDPLLAPVLCPFDKVIHLSVYGDRAVLSDLLGYLVPQLLPAVFLSLLFRKTNVLWALIQSVPLAVCIWNPIAGGAFVLDAFLYGAIGATIGFTVCDAFTRKQPKIFRRIGLTVFLLAYISLALLLILDGGTPTGRLTFSTNAPLSSVTLNAKLDPPSSVPCYQAENRYDYTYPSSQTSAPAYPLDEEARWSKAALEAIKNANSTQLNELSDRELQLVSFDVKADSIRLSFAPLMNGSFISGAELLIALNYDGTLLSVSSNVPFDFVEKKSIPVADPDRILREISIGKRAYTLFGRGEKLVLEHLEVRYFSNPDTGYYLPYWHGEGYNEYDESIVIRIDAMR